MHFFKRARLFGIWVLLGLSTLDQPTTWADNSPQAALLNIAQPWYFSGPSVAIAADDSLWIMNAFTARIMHFKADGTLIGEFGSNGNGAGQFNTPESIAVAPDSSLWIADTLNNRLQHISADGAFLGTVGSSGTNAAQFKAPSSVAVAADGSIWVADTQNHRLQHLTADGTPILQIGKYGSLNAQFKNPEVVAMGPDGSVWATDNDNARLQHFKADGTFIAAIPARYGNSPYYPNGIAIAADNTLWVTNLADGKLLHMQNNGQAIEKADIDFSMSIYDPVSVAIAADGTLWLGDSHFDQVQHRNANGILINQLGTGRTINTTFDDQTRKLWLDDVIVDGQHYVAELTDQGNFRFKLTYYYLRKTSIENPASAFNESAGQVIIPVLAFKNHYYQVVLQAEPNGIFSVKSVSPL